MGRYGPDYVKMSHSTVISSAIEGAPEKVHQVYIYMNDQTAERICNFAPVY